MGYLGTYCEIQERHSVFRWTGIKDELELWDNFTDFKFLVESFEYQDSTSLKIIQKNGDVEIVHYNDLIMLHISDEKAFDKVTVIGPAALSHCFKRLH